ncbi:mitochondrial 39-S ribosomal protein L47 (MRP-L47)-domain-containing protein [Rhodocollybia butyracea]|uniref:Large ribosomal subunit protein uL29m n=1 Tax=Rhodocollybia butyracea TaxID=206335 RepID=A0A9P5UG05_9AGAR|nr:mitochondrial 39-S ribosomal protein L47 (MRP-L47)-domain-containing protein [Rhodocollybia butyracea]
MLSVLRRSYVAQPRLLRNFAELVHVNTPQPSAPPPLRGTIDPPPPRAIGGPDKGQNIPDTENTVVPVRLGNRVPVREDHGLYGFFRQREPEEGQTLVGEARYETVGGSYGMEMERSGRAWRASEIRLKSFKDLHVLWYVLLRERNLLATQNEDLRRMGAMAVTRLLDDRMRMCRKSMARIKYVMNERRLAYQGAIKLAEEEKTDHIAKVVLKQQLTEHEDDSKNISVRRLRAQRKAAQRARLAARDTVQTTTVESEAQPEQVVQLEAQAELGEPKASATAEAQPPVAKLEHAPPKPRSSIKSDRAEATEAVTEGLFGSRGRQQRRR